MVDKQGLDGGDGSRVSADLGGKRSLTSAGLAERAMSFIPAKNAGTVKQAA